jgi:choline dehydrogenase
MYTRPEAFGEFDYIVLGAGSAGCVLANRLSKDPKNRVLLLEAGGKDNYIWIHVPVGYLYTMMNPRTDWCYHTAPQPFLNDKVIGWPRGRVLGGSSSINGMLYIRGQAADYDHWRQLGNEGWGWDDVLPYFKRSEDYYAGPDTVHGSGGEWRVEAPRVKWKVLDAFRDAAEAVGIPKIDDFNRGDNNGSAYFRVNQRKGWRVSTATAFLRPAAGRANLRVQTGALIRRAVVQDGEARGVEFDVAGRTFYASASGEVILSAGTIGSPAILERSGIGDGARLRALGIEPVAHLQGVGENLQDHLAWRLVYKVDGTGTLNSRANSLIGKASIGLEYLLFRTGPMALAPTQLGVFTRSDARFATPNIQYNVQPLSLKEWGAPLDPFPAFTISVCDLRPQSRGTCHITSAEVHANPEIQPLYLSAEADRRVALESIRLTRRIVSQAPLQRYNATEIRPGPKVQSDTDLVASLEGIASTVFHPVGTAKMGTDALSVVDPQLRVHGIRSLRVVDASVMPLVVSGNTNSPTIMIAEKGADMILQSARQGKVSHQP